MVSKTELRNYRKVQKDKKEKPEEEEGRQGNELRISTLRSPKKYISLAIDMLESGENKVVILKGRGQAVSKVVNIAEVVKRRVKGLHQLTAMESIEVVDVYEPKDPSKTGEKNIEIKKYICGLSITLSLEQLDKSQPGYQEPIDEAEVVAEDKERREKRPPRKTGGTRGGRGRGRGGGKGSKGARGGSARGGFRGGAVSRGRGGSARGGGYR